VVLQEILLEDRHLVADIIMEKPSTKVLMEVVTTSTVMGIKRTLVDQNVIVELNNI